MKTIPLILTFLLFPILIFARQEYEPTNKNPYGLPNPEAPEEIADFAPLIGSSKCTSETRAADGAWNEPEDMVWKFKFIMNGMAIQDETFRESSYSGSIRQFAPDSAAWFVHYYSSTGTPSRLPTWEGGKTDDSTIILYMDQKSPNGLDGKYKITFSEMTENSFEWLGEWVSLDESFNYPTWKISCQKE